MKRRPLFQPAFRRFRMSHLLVELSVALLCTESASAATKYWDISTAAGIQGGSGNWNTGTTANWNTSLMATGQTTWADNDDAYFFASSTPTLTSNILANSLTVGGGGSATISTGSFTLTLGAGGITNDSPNTMTVSGLLSLSTAQTWSSFNGNLTVSASIGGAGGFTKMGAGTLTLSGANNTYTGATSLNVGTTTATQSGGTASAGVTPFGTGALSLNGGTLKLVPAATGDTYVSAANAAVGTQFTYGGDGVFSLTRNGTSNLTFTAGNASATGSVLARANNGTLVIQGSAAGTLGTSEFFKVNGAAPANSAGTGTAGIASPSIVGLSATVAGSGDFLTYDATNGFVAATSKYTTRSGAFAPASTTEISNVTASGTLTGNTGAILVQPGATLTLSGTVTVGANTAGTQAGVILNGSGSLSGGTLNFGSSEGIIYTFGSNGKGLPAISGTGGVTLASALPSSGAVFGLSNNTFSGGLTINGVQVNFGGVSDSQFGAAGNVVTVNGAQFTYNNSTPIGAARTLVLGPAGGETNAGNQAQNFSFNISGTGALTTNGGSGGYTTLSGNNTFTGGLIVNGGLVAVANNTSLGGASTPITISAAGVYSTSTLVILGTELTSFGTHPVAITGGPATSGGLSIQSAANVFTVGNNVIQGSNGFQKLGAGTLVIAGANLYTGGSYLTGGELRLDASQGGSMNSGSGLNFGGGTFRFLGNTTGTSAQTFSDVSFGYNDRGNGIVFGGNLIVDSNGGTGTTLNLGTLNYSSARNTTYFNVQTLGGSATITTSTAKDATGIYGGRMTFNGADWLTSTGTGSPYTLAAYTGYTALNTTGGTTDTNNSVVNGSATLGAGTTVTNTLKVTSIGAGQSLTIGTGNALTLTAGGLLSTVANDYTISGGTLTSATTTNSTSELLIHQYGTGNLTISSVIANGNGASLLTKTGTGTLILTGTNTYTGATYVRGGVLSISALSNLGANTSAGLMLDGGTLQTTASLSTGRTVTVGSSGGGFDVIGGTTLTLTGTVQSYTITNSGSAALTLNSSDPNGTGTQGVLLLNTNQFLLSEGANINGGILRLGSGTPNSFGAGGGSLVNFGATSNGRFQVNGNSVTVGGLASASTAAIVENNNASSAVLTVTSGMNTTYAGTIQNGAAGGSLGLTKNGAGSLTLTGTNPYSGPTLVQNGALVVNGTNAASAVTVGTTSNLANVAALRGTGTVGNVTVGVANNNSGATLQPGTATTLGNLTTGTLTFTPGALTGSAATSTVPTFSVRLGPTASGNPVLGTNYDAVTTTGALTLNNANLALTLQTGFAGSGDNLYYIVNNTSTQASGAEGTFSFNGTTLAQDATFTTGGQTFQISYTSDFNTRTFDGTGNDVSLMVVAVPEAATWMVPLLLVATGWYRFSTRRRAVRPA